MATRPAVAPSLVFAAPLDGQLDKRWWRHFDELGAQYSWGAEGAMTALRADPLVRQEILADAEESGGAFSLLGLLLAWHLTARNALCPAPPLLTALLDTHLELAPRDAARVPSPVLAVFFPLGHEPTIPTPEGEAKLQGLLASDSHALLMAVANAGNPALDPATLPPVRDLLEEDRTREASDRTLGIFAISRTDAGELLEWVSLPLVDDDLAACVEAGRKRSLRAGGESGAAERAAIYFELVLKLVLYTNSVGADRAPMPYVPQRRPGTSRIARATHQHLARRWGSRVLLGARLEMRETVVRVTASSPSEHAAERKAVALHSVRGHFRRVPHGQGAAERRIQWIPPYMRGNDAAGRVIERTYALEPPPHDP